MIAFKITLNIMGDNLKTEALIRSIKEPFILASVHQVGDKIRSQSGKKYDSNLLSIWNPKKFTLQGEGLSYEEWFVNFIEKNHSQFISLGMEDLDLFIEVYSTGDQCNFEIFNKNLLKRLLKYDVSLPISIYILKEDEIINLVN